MKGTPAKLEPQQPQTVQFALSQATLNQIEAEARRQGLSASETLEHLVRSYFEQQPQTELSQQLQNAQQQICQQQQALEELQLSQSLQSQMEQESLKTQAELLALLDTLLTAAPVGMCFIDPQLRFVRINPMLAALNGLPREAHLGQKFPELFPEMAERFGPIIEQVLSTGEPILNLELSGIPPGSTEPGYWLANYYPVRDEQGQVLGVGLILADITEQQKALRDRQQLEQELRQREAHFRQIFECNMLGMGFCSLDGPILQANHAFLELVGYTQEEIQNLSWQEITPPEYLARDKQALQESLRLGYCTPYEKEILHKSGRRIPLLVGGACLEDSPSRGVFYAIDQTERKQAELARRQAEERLQVAVKNSPMNVFSQDCQLRYTWMYNPSFDYRVEEILGKRDIDLIPLEDAQVLENIKRKAIATGVGCREEVKVTMGGRDWYFDLTVEPLYEANGQISGITCAAVDVSDRKQLLHREQALRAEADLIRRQLTTVFETSPVGMAFLDRQQRFVTLNEALAEMNGLSREQHLDRTIAELFGESDPNLVQLFEQIYATGEPFISPQHPVSVPGRQDRCPGYYNVYYLPNITREGEVEGVVVYVVDVTARVRLERGQHFLSQASAVLASSLDYQTTLEQVARLAVPNLADWCVVHVVEENGSISQLAVAHVDPAKIEWARTIQQKYPLNLDEPRGAAYTLRTGKSELIAEIPDEILVEAARSPEHLEMLREVGFHAVMTVAMKAQDRILGVISFVSAESRRRYDAMDLRFAEELASRAALAVDNARLYSLAQQQRVLAEQANRIKDEFLAVLSHELRTPLNPILGWTKLLRSQPFQPEKADRALETIERNVKLQTQLIEDLLDISRILQGKLNLSVKPVNLVALIQAALETVRLSAETKGIHLQTQLNPELPPLMGDSGRLQQVVWNLLSNAIKFTPSGGAVEVELSQGANYAQIRVSDTGIGIHPDFLPHVFEYFRQADSSTTRSFGGLGLGLAIAQHIVELHGGQIWAESLGKDRGATFMVRLPIWVDSASQEPANLASSENADSRSLLAGVRVLAVDDDADMRELMFFILEQEGAEAIVTGSATDVLTVLPNVQPDILIADIGMPDVDGYTLLRQIRRLNVAQGGEVPAIALTAYAGEWDRQQALAAGFQMHLAKPVEPDALVKAIAKVLNNSGEEEE
ncbi:PAS domain-containing protein [Oscillatoria laete-virens NRMC-F 0139]|nr:PAS domain-containing protein [Oscillatoria laete-virens]MDL5054297.1 PAS domain-containing protein [Oscillatoria laete-virens NRMC-F 0139]